MRRRTLIGIATLGVLAAAGAGVFVATRTSGRPAGSGLSPPQQAVMARIAEAVLEGTLPEQGPQREHAISQHLARLDATVAGLQAVAREEFRMLLGVIGHPLGRRLVLGLHEPWDTAPVSTIQAALHGWRDSRILPLQQAYHAMRDLTNASYFADPASWPTLGYPGPRTLFESVRLPGEVRE